MKTSKFFVLTINATWYVNNQNTIIHRSRESAECSIYLRCKEFSHGWSVSRSEFRKFWEQNIFEVFRVLDVTTVRSSVLEVWVVKLRGHLIKWVSLCLTDRTMFELKSFASTPSLLRPFLRHLSFRRISHRLRRKQIIFQMRLRKICSFNNHNLRLNIVIAQPVLTYLPRWCIGVASRLLL